MMDFAAGAPRARVAEVLITQCTHECTGPVPAPSAPPGLTVDKAAKNTHKK